MSESDFKVNEDEKSGNKENVNSEQLDDIAHAKTKLKEWMSEHPAIKNLRDKYGKKPTPDTSTPNTEHSLNKSTNSQKSMDGELNSLPNFSKTPIDDLAITLSTSFQILAERYCRAQFRVQGMNLSLEEVAAVNGMLPIIIDRAAGGSGEDMDPRLAYGLVIDKKALMEVQPVITIRSGDMETPNYWDEKLQDVIDTLNSIAQANGGLVDLDADYQNWFERLQKGEIVVSHDKSSLLDLFNDLLPPIAPSPQVRAPAVTREAIANYLVAPLVTTLLESKRLNPRPACYLVQTSFANFHGDLAKAFLAELDIEQKPQLLVDRDFESKPASYSKSSLSLDEKIVDALAFGSDVILISENMHRLPVPVRELVDRTLSIERFTVELLESALKKLFNLPRRPVIQDNPWVRLVRPNDLLVNAFAGTDVATEIRRTVERRMALVNADNALSLDDLHGMPEAKEWARQLIEDIRLAEKGPLKGGISWNDVDKGALFEGPPGVGKTTIARAIAKSCGLKFVNASASAWQAAGHLDEHITAMRTSFIQAKEYAPSLIFIDEIDSIGNRETLSGENKQYQVEVINALLQELDGFEGRHKIIVLAATNYAENVDPALRRPGRLDRILRIRYPNAEGLNGIYRHYLGNVPHTLADEDFLHIARSSLGLTGADVELFVRSARRECRRNGRTEITANDLLRQVFRTPPKNLRQPISETELHRTAVHEAGHALLRLLDPDMRDGLSYVSIVPRSDGKMGFVATFNPPHIVTTPVHCLNNIAMTLAGRAAEAMVFGEENVSLGSGGTNERCDLASATQQVEYLLTRQGMGSSSKLLWRKTGIQDSAELREQANSILSEQYERTLQCLKNNRVNFDAIVELLMTQQEVSGAELRKLVLQKKEND